MFINYCSRDLGAMDTDSNYFSGGETERGESKLSNYTDRKLSDSSSCSDTTSCCPGYKMSGGDANYLSDSNFSSDSYSVTTERRHVYECRYSSRRVEKTYRGHHNSAQRSPDAVRYSNAASASAVGWTGDRNSDRA